MNISELIADRLMNAACEFQAKSTKARGYCREQFRRAEAMDDNTLRILIDGQIAHLAEKTTRKIPHTSPETTYQLVASASFIRTHFIITDMVMDGDLVEAATLLRKQLEAVSRLHEIEHKPLDSLTRKTPNVSAVLKQGSGRIYGLLSEIAHTATLNVADFLHVVEDNDLIGPSLLPRFTKKSRLCSDINSFLALIFLTWLIHKLPSWYPGYDSSEDEKALISAYMLANELDILTLPDGE